jgi:hypothetical protein
MSRGKALFSAGDSYPKMHWTGAQLAEFLKDHLGPTFESEGLSTSVVRKRLRFSLRFPSVFVPSLSWQIIVVHNS